MNDFLGPDPTPDTAFGYLFDDPEQFCSRCFAGVNSSEHHEKCVTTGHAEDGESA